MFEFNFSEKIDSFMNKGFVKIVFSLFKDKFFKEKLYARIDIFLFRKCGGILYVTSKIINLELIVCVSLYIGFEILENVECCNSFVDGNC